MNTKCLSDLLCRHLYSQQSRKDTYSSEFSQPVLHHTGRLVSWPDNLSKPSAGSPCKSPCAEQQWDTFLGTEVKLLFTKRKRQVSHKLGLKCCKTPPESGAGRYFPPHKREGCFSGIRLFSSTPPPTTTPPPQGGEDSPPSITYHQAIMN